MKPDSSSLEKMNVLVVEDSNDLRDSVLSLLKARGFNVLGANNGNTALELVRSAEVSMVISDVNMPGMDGLALFEKLRGQNIPFIFMTGYSDLLDIDKALKLGASEFLTKPFTTDELMASVDLVAHQVIQGSLVFGDLDVDGDYCRVHVNDFTSGSKAALDLFLRLSAAKYVQIARSGGNVSADRLSMYKAKGLEYLYIRKEDFAKYVGFNLRVAQVVAKDKNPISKGQKLKLLKHTTTIYLENIFVNGLDQGSFDNAKSLVEATAKVAIESDSIYGLLESLRKSGDDVYTHSMGVSLYSTLIAKAFGWTNATMLFKVALAGMLHDVGKKELPQSLIRKLRQDMNQEERQLYETHPIRGKEILSSIRCIPEEIIFCAVQHHESMAGTGYPFHLPRARISPLAKLIAVANEFCNLVLSGSGEPLDPHEALGKMWSLQQHELDPFFLRQLMELFNYPLPTELSKLVKHKT